MVQPERRNARIRRLGTVSGSQRQRMNPIVAQRQLLREILDEVLQFQPQARYESLPADPMYLKVCLARRHLRQLKPKSRGTSFKSRHETVSPRFLNSLAIRSWPNAGCSMSGGRSGSNV